MNEFLSIFLTWQFVLLALGISAITYVIRTIIEYCVLNNPKMPGNSASRFWRDFVLVLLPVALGMIFPLVGKSFPYPQIIHEAYSRFLFGSTAGLLSPILYRVIKAMLWRNASSNQPPPYFPGFPVSPSNDTPILPKADDANQDPG